MAKGTKDGRNPKEGTHGGNRGGEHGRRASDQPRKSSQAAGKDPHRGER